MQIKKNMQLHCLFLLIVSLTLPSLAESECEILMPYSSMTYLTQAQLTRYNLTDPCSTACSSGYSGDFCVNQNQFFTSLPMGPWNLAGYYSSGSGLLRTMSIDVTSIDYIQYTKKDSVLIGIKNAMTTSSALVMIFLFSNSIKTVLSPSIGGSFDSLLMRNGIAYLSRTTKIKLANGQNGEVYDVASLSDTYEIQSLASVASNIALLEVFAERGMVTTFMYLPLTKSIVVCYPDGTCYTWANVDINGIACGIGCPSTVYASSLNTILRVTSTGATTLKVVGSAIYCFTGLSPLNVLLYKSTSTMFQHNLATQSSSNIPLGIPDSGLKKVCFLDVSELNNQILIVQDGIIRTLEAVQLLCGYGLTSQAMQANSQSACVPCPNPPDNAYWIEGSSVCEWECLAQFTRKGSKCVAQTVMPCPTYYVADSLNAGLCTPSLLPWVEQGNYVVSIQYSSQLTLPGSSSPYITASIGASFVLQISMPNIHVSRNSGATWTSSGMVFTGSPVSSCPINALNRYYYISSDNSNMLWTAFYYSVSSSIQHCLWVVDASTVVSAQNTHLTVTQSWSIGGKLCSSTGDKSFVYLLFCGTHTIYYAQMTRGSNILPLAGGMKAGYTDSSLRTSLFQFPSSMVLYDLRLYVADTGNCVIRELDLQRDTVHTVAGTAGFCQRVDDGMQKAMMANPINLTYTSFPGFFLFTDKYSTESNAVIRQFHAPSSTVQTIKAMPNNYYNDMLAVGGKVVIRVENNLVFLSATPATCPAGSSSLTGGALTVGGCISCGRGFYSDAVAGACKNCSMIFCDQPGKMLVPCQPDADSYCGQCTNKPAGNTQYVGASSITGTSSGGGDCAWAFTPPCPKAYYAKDGLCFNCPAWCTTAVAGSTSLSHCFCMGNGIWEDGKCIIPASLVLFPLLTSCTSYTVDSPDGICPCEPGEYIQQINPKICTPCQAGSYSADGTACITCPDKTEPSLDRATCRCAGGLHDASDLTALMQQCECGPGKAFLKTPLMCKNCA